MHLFWMVSWWGRVWNGDHDDDDGDHDDDDDDDDDWSDDDDDVFRLSVSKQSKVFLPESPFPHAEVWKKKVL